MYRRAFTLIELLVVIAIIAILAAILFPVFAQAKESAKITAALSQTKQMGTAVIMYGSDSDDLFPQAMAKRPNGGMWGAGLLHPFPADNLPTDPTWSLPERVNMANSMWANSIQPYAKNLDIMQVQGLKESSIATDVPKNPNARTCLTMNGLLQSLSQTSINAPSTVVMLWPGQGGTNIKSRASMNPALNCGTSDDCVFNPGGAPSSTVGACGAGANDCMFSFAPTTQSVWVFNRRRSPMVRTDTSAKVFVVGQVIAPNSIAFGNGVLSDPYARVDATGANAAFWKCYFDGSDNVQFDATKNYTCYFRPDRTR